MSTLSNFLYGLVINFALVSSTTVYECYNTTDKGASYLGRVTRQDCISWKEANSSYANYFEDHKYCRNPLSAQVPRPYCYIGAESRYEQCEIQICGINCSTQPSGTLPPCEILVTCSPPPLSTHFSWSPDRTVFYEGEQIYFNCSLNGYRPLVKYSTCRNGSFDYQKVECRVPDFECYNTTDKGASYRGRVTRSDCITWKEANSTFANYFEDHKYCRNPLSAQVPRPYCYIGAKSRYEQCEDVKKCDEDCFVAPSAGQTACDYYFTCKRPNIFTNINWSPDNTLYYADDVINFVCPEKGYLPTVNSSTCLANGSFVHVNVECKGIQCPDFPPILNMKSNGQSTFRYPQFVNVTCERGYIKIGPELVNCTHTGHWSPQPNCTGIECPVLEQVTNSFNNHTRQHRFPDSVTISCQKGFVIQGSKELNCTLNGTWNHNLPTCQGIQCPDFPSILNMEPTGQSTFRYPQFVNVTCERGYIKIGPELVNCTHTGHWSPQPNCTGIPCGKIPNIIKAKSKNDTTEYRHPDDVKIECEDGYQLKGSDKLTCTDTGVWSQTPNCTKIEKVPSAPLTMSPTGAIAGGSVAAIVVIIVIVGIIVVTKRRQSGKKKERRPRMESISNPPNLYANSQVTQKDSSNDDHAYYDFEDTKIAKTAIKIDEFYEYVHNGRDKDGAIEKEFNLLKTGLLKPATAAQLQANTKKNKYKNIYPYDETRVELDLVDGIENSDYVNASFINGFDQLKQYIASQGPLGPTVVDWWRMVWQFNCGKIVMLTRVFEMGKQKCIQYWPELEEKSKTYGNIEVVIAKEYIYSDFTIRTLKLTQDKETKTVTQFHFTAWPDKDVPKYASSLVHFRHQVLNTKCTGTGPLVVHCSAGIGRTGTYIALDYAVREAKQLGYVDVFRCVETLRRQRLNMVQTSRQYVFLHESVLEALMCKDAGIPAAEFRDVFQQSMKKENGKTQLEKDYELMMNMGHKHDEEVFDKGKSPENKTKNRYKNILPVESEMPILTTYVEGLNDYINAVFLPGYKNNKTFLITQMPLESTVIDLWRMIWDYNVEMIVMMNQSYEQKEVYWPTATDKSSAYGPFSVSLQDMQTDKVMTKIHLKLSYKNEDPRELKVLQSKFWSDDSSIPSSMDDFITFMTELEREHEHQGNGPVVVHCSNGCDKSGLYCVMATVIERLKIEQDVDIQHIIKNMRNRRPQIIPNFDQYRFLHEAAIRYLQQFDTYSNFQ